LETFQNFLILGFISSLKIIPEKNPEIIFKPRKITETTENSEKIFQGIYERDGSKERV
jgi:hypothetical protein